MIQRQKLTLTGAVGKIQAVLEWDEKQTDSFTQVGIAIVLHPHPLYGGNMDNKVVQTIAKSYMECGFVVLRFNFRGIGNSEGSYDEGRGECEDMLLMASWLQDKYPNKPLYVGGFSFGAFVAVMAHQKIIFERMVLVGTAVGHFSVEQVPNDTIVIHGSKDDTVPLVAVLDWAMPQKIWVHVLSGADHFFHQRLIELRYLIISMLKAGEK